MKSIWILAPLALSACSSSSMPYETLPGTPVHFSMKTTVPAGTEVHKCQFVTMPLGESYMIAGTHTYTVGSHHLLLFRTDLTSIPTDLEGLLDCYESAGGSMMSHVRGVVYGSQVPHGTSIMPDGVGLPLGSEEVLLFQSHYLNASTDDLNAEVDVTLQITNDASKITERAGVLLYYDPFIDVPPNSKAKANARCTLSQDIRLLSAFPHYHRRGVSYEAFLDPPSMGPATTPFYTSTDWQHPAPFGQPIDIKAGTAIRYYCDYNNTSGAEYFQGQSAADNEMCVFSGLYYPAMDPSEEFCLNSFDMFGSGAKTCAETMSCIQTCPAGSAPSGLGDGSADVDPCWQKCFVASCPAASAPLIAALSCIGTHCQSECAAGGSTCASCVSANCLTEYSGCQTATCN